VPFGSRTLNSIRIHSNKTITYLGRPLLLNASYAENKSYLALVNFTSEQNVLQTRGVRVHELSVWEFHTYTGVSDAEKFGLIYRSRFFNQYHTM
jgi:hypothetical protein